MNISKKLSQELEIRESQVEAAIKLIDEGNTIPFIARYRKEATGSLNDEVLRNLYDRLLSLRNLEDRRQVILASINEQGKLSLELKACIEAAETMVALEDLYRPYKPKRRTRATIAMEKGLEPLARLVLAQESVDIDEEAKKYIDPEKEVSSVEDAINGAMDILAETFSDNASVRSKIRAATLRDGIILSRAKDSETETVYEPYYEYEEPVKRIPGHRILAINRGEKENVLNIKIEAPVEKILDSMGKQFIKTNDERLCKILEETIKDSYDRLIAPSIEREIRNELTDNAEDGAIKVFGENLKQLIMQRPIAGHVVLGWDPAFRTGCKLAVVDETGKVIDTTVIYPTPPQEKVEEAKNLLEKWVKKYGIDIISLGNGTASRESEKVIADFIKECPQKLSYIIVNEAGASVYSASKLATEEFPEFDVGQRSAASMARRLQDPMAELVKIDPKSIGVGQYQHDMDQKKLTASLEGVVEDCVNRVGVDLNTGSASLFEYVSGINKTIAKNIVSFREEHGSFSERKELLKVPKLGPKAYEQCAGFMRINGGKEPLDSTGVHPESYSVTEKLLKKLGVDKSAISDRKLGGISKKVSDISAIAEELSVGEPTLKDIIAELEKPARDPREDMPAPILRSDVMELSDLKEGMVLKGTVRNIVDFGAFVDIGVHQDGLVHISRMSNRFIKHPLEVVAVGDIVEVEVIGIDEKKKRIQLAIIR